MVEQIWMLARTESHGSVGTWYGYWDSEAEARQFAQSHAEGGDETPCGRLCNNQASWFEARPKTPGEIEELSHIRVKERVDGVPENATEV